MRSKSAHSPLDEIAKISPGLAELTRNLLLDDVWERPGLSKRDRSLITVAALIALNRTDQLPTHFRWAVQNGISREEIGEVLTHLAFYCGWPSAISAGVVAQSITSEPAASADD